MTRFRFRLQTLLNLREAVRQERRGQLAEALAAERALALRKAAIASELVAGQRTVRHGLAAGRIDLDGLLAVDDYKRALRRELADLARDEVALQSQIAERQQAVAGADREVRVLEKLRERRLADFRREEAVAEIKRVDEVATRATGAGFRS